MPIKNKKYAKDMTEVHLSDRGLTSLEMFTDFPNLEEIWLNNNKVSKPHLAFSLTFISSQLQNLDDISSNFRCKQVYCQNNELSNIKGLWKYKFLNVLLVGDNELRDLDEFLKFLTNFQYLI